VAAIELIKTVQAILRIEPTENAMKLLMIPAFVAMTLIAAANTVLRPPSSLTRHAAGLQEIYIQALSERPPK
jgi:hypothetical protein